MITAMSSSSTAEGWGQRSNDGTAFLPIYALCTPRCLLSASCGAISNFVVLKRLSFLGAGLARAFGGVALGVLLGRTALYRRLHLGVNHDRHGREGHLARIPPLALAMSPPWPWGRYFRIARSYNFDVFGYLFGNILAVTEADLIITGVLGAAVLLLLGLFHKELVFLAFDEEMAQVVGLPVRFCTICCCPLWR